MSRLVVEKAEHKPREKRGDNFALAFPARYAFLGLVLVDMWNPLPTAWGQWG